MRHVLERASLITVGSVITDDAIESALDIKLDVAKASDTNADPFMWGEKARISAALDKHHWRISDAAASLGISRWTLRRRLKDLDIRK